MLTSTAALGVMQGGLVLKEYKWDIAFVILAVAPLLISLGIDIFVTNEYYWFQRSGALTVLFAALLGFHQDKHFITQEDESYRVNEKPIITGKTLTEYRKKLKFLAIVLALSGTLIWGYGDLLFKYNA